MERGSKGGGGDAVHGPGVWDQVVLAERRGTTGTGCHGLRPPPAGYRVSLERPGRDGLVFLCDGWAFYPEVRLELADFLPGGRAEREAQRPAAALQGERPDRAQGNLPPDAAGRRTAGGLYAGNTRPL